MAGVSSDYPRACLNCKTRVKIDTETCPKCGDRLKARTEDACGPIKDGGWHCRPWRCDKPTECPIDTEGVA